MSYNKIYRKGKFTRGCLAGIISLLFIMKPSSGQETMFKATFEEQSLYSDIGLSFAQTKGPGVLEVVANPSPDSVNSSGYVLRTRVGQSSSVRAEYSNATANRYPTDGETHIYTWKKFYPVNMFDDITINWMLVGQWKTWPCEEYGAHGEYICGGGGIFNEIDLHNGRTEDYRYRASPDCNTISEDINEGVWEEYTQIIHWTNTQNGFYHLFKNKELIGGATNVKTLFDNFPSDHSCDIYFTLGLYCNWSSSVKDSISYCIDDFCVYKVTGESDFENICPECAGQIPETSTDILDNYERNFKVYPNPFKSYIIVQLKYRSLVSIYDINGNLVYEQDLGAGENRIDLDVDPGTFFIKVTDNCSNKTCVEKLVI